MRSSVLCAAALASVALACDSCEHPDRDVVLTRNVRRMQPEAQSAAVAPRAPLAWGQLNFIHTTDTHGWLEGHLKEKNYGADWGDFASFVKDMRRNAEAYDVDLLVIDTGDLHDGAGLSDATSPNGVLSNPIFETIGYDLLTIGNHELYLSDIAYETFRNFSSHYGDRYLTSNVQIYNPSSSQYEYIGKTHRYFTTKKGLRIMSFGLLYDFTGNSNVSKVLPATQVVNQTWFKNALQTKAPIDLFLLIGHNPVRPTSSTSTFKTLFNAIRAVYPDTPIQIFGGHTHVRDFAVYDDKSTALESGRYCETLGWLSISGFDTSSYSGCKAPHGVPHPTMRATKVGASGSASASLSPLVSSTSSSQLLYSRRYLDWNRLTMEYHAKSSKVREFDVAKGVKITKNITATRHGLNLTSLFGCAPQTWCISCAPFGSNGSIYTVLTEALSTVVKNESRADVPRLIVLNTGSVRFDLLKGPFTYDDSFIVSPFTDAFQYIANVPYSAAIQVLPALNAGAYEKRSIDSGDFGFYNPSVPQADACIDPPSFNDGIVANRTLGRVIRRQAVTPGYTTTDDFGSDGDDTIHTEIPRYSVPNDFQAMGSFPANGSMPSTVDMVFLDFIADDVIAALNNAGQSYSTADVSYYLPESFTTNSYLPAYAKIAPDWQKNVPNCPVGLGIGYNDTTSS
nr:secreted protein [Quercus suber]